MKFHAELSDDSSKMVDVIVLALSRQPDSSQSGIIIPVIIDSRTSTLRISVVIPHYTNAEQTLALVQSLRNKDDYGELKTKETEIIVVDDASPDGSGKKLEAERESLDFKLAVNPSNLGFAGTANRGASLASGTILVVSNSDITFLKEATPTDVINELASQLTDTGIGAVMPLVYNTALSEVENLNSLWAHRGLLWLKRLDSTAEFSDYARLFPKEHPCSDETVNTVLCGAFFAMRRLDFLRLGGFNPRFSPYYWEDVELGVRITTGGARVAATTCAVVLHNHNQSIGSNTTESHRWRVMQQNQLLFTVMWGRKLGVMKMKIWHFLRAAKCFVEGELALGLGFLGIKRF